METTLDSQFDLIKHWGVASDALHLNTCSQRIPIDENTGQGTFERYDFANISLSRVHCQFKHTQHLINEDCKIAYSIHFNLQGSSHVSLNNSTFSNPLGDFQTIMHNAPSVWLVKGNLGRYSTTIEAGEEIKAFYIELDDGFISTLTKQLQTKKDFNNLILAKLIATKGYLSLPLALNTQTEILVKQAWQLFNTASPTDELSFMALQGQTLTFISDFLLQPIHKLTILSNDNQHSHHLNKAYQAKLLLDEYYQFNWTIRDLAKKAGTNECYLKQQFKQLTQLTIGEYRTQKRLQVACELLTQGNKVADVASQTGFNSSDYFIKVFKKYYNHHPADILKI